MAVIKLIFFIVLSIIKYSEQISDGRDATERTFPYMVSLQGAFEDHFCGGSILNNQWIITAAHCLTGKKANQIVVKVGSIVLHGRNAKTYYGKDIKIYDDYNTVTKRNDIALLQVTPNIDFNDKVSSVSISTSGGLKKGDRAVFAGWGRLSRGGVHPEILQEMDVTVNSAGKENTKITGFYDTQICSLVDKAALCNGDSGGPLTVNGKLVGIASITRCVCLSTYNVYTNVNYYTSWIKKYVTV